jgi:branched-chain amino acid aminotransferase
MIVFLNGRFVPGREAVVSVFDRSFLYGDGLFETLLVCNGKLFRLHQHLDRLQHGADFLSLRLPFSRGATANFARELIERNRLAHGSLRLTLSRGVGTRGYSPRGADYPFLVITVYESAAHDPHYPPQWRLGTSLFRLPAKEPLARFKTCNKLPQILARAEAEARGADEALLLNTDGLVIEAASSNLFWIADGTVCTPPLESGVLAGVTRAVVLEVCQRLGLPTRLALLPPEALSQQDAVFLSLSTLGIVEAVTLDGVELRRSAVVARIRDCYWQLVHQETA